MPDTPPSILNQIITHTQARLWQVPFEQPLAGGTITHAEMIVVDLHTNQGMSGRGFGCFYGDSPAIPLAAARQLIEIEIAGQPMSHPEEFARRMRKRAARYGLGAFVTGQAAIDIALWDLFAKLLNVPVAVAAGGAARAVPVYRTFGFGNDLEKTLEKTEAAFRAGIHTVKIHAHSNISDERIIRAVSDEIAGRGQFMVDSTQGCTLTQATRLADVIAEAGGLWFEEPVPTHDIGAYEQLARTSRVAIATGENIRGYDAARPFILGQLCRTIQPDFFRMGGFTECLRVARAAEMAGIDVAAHFMPYIAIHLAAAAPNVTWVEHLPLIEHIFGGLPTLDSQGRATLESKPGFGLPWDDAMEREFAVRGQ